MNATAFPMAFDGQLTTNTLLHPIPPTSIELYNVFNPFLIRWANLSAQYVPMRMEDMAALPLEQSIFFSQPMNGLLVVRSRKDFEKLLAEASPRQKSKNSTHPSGLFLEMSVLFWHFMVMKTWKADTRTLSPAVLKSSVPLDWPDRKPDSACTVFIKDFPIEIRLWAAVSEEEMKSWKKPKK